MRSTVLSEPKWLETYYAALEFIYWEPQHLGRIKNPKTKLDSFEKVAPRLRTLEVTLNHNLDQFFRLAPNGLRSALFGLAFQRGFGNPFHMHGRHFDKEFELVYATQPDFFFESSHEVACIEMKIEARSTISQVLKYALLGLATEMRRGAPREHFLLMLGPKSFSSLWKEGFQDVSALHEALKTADLAAFLEKQPLRFRPHMSAFAQVVNGLRVSWLTYDELARFMRNQAPPLEDSSPGAEVYRKLVSGMTGELALRQLANEA